VKRVDQITFSGTFARQQGQTVYYITERCVFELTEEGLKLIEIAPGVDLERDILDQMECTPLVPDVAPKMDAVIFREEPTGLSLGAPVDLEERLNYDAKNMALYNNFYLAPRVRRTFFEMVEHNEENYAFMLLVPNKCIRSARSYDNRDYLSSAYSV
jgi:hypothetical protein